MLAFRQKFSFVNCLLSMFGTEICAEFLEKRLPPTSGSGCLLHCLEGSLAGYYFEIKNWWVGEEKNLFLSPCSIHPCSLTSIYTLDFQLFWFWVFLLFCFSLVCFCFIVETGFFPKLFLLFMSPNKTNCCGRIYATTPRFLLLCSIIPMLFHHKRQEKKKLTKPKGGL